MTEALFPVKLCNKCHEKPGVSHNGRCAECHRKEVADFRSAQRAKRRAEREAMSQLENIMGRLFKAAGRKRSTLSKGNSNEQHPGAEGIMSATSRG